MSRTSQNLVFHELIGLECRILHSTDPTQTGLQGKVTGETRNTITLKTNSKEATLQKRNLTLEFDLQATTVRLDGRSLQGRPEDRLSKMR